MKALKKQWSCKSKTEEILNSMNFISLIILSFLIIIIALIINFDHLLISLLCLEGLILIIVLFVPLSTKIFNSPTYQIRLLLLTFSACEASLGLRIIVKLTRTHGSDLLSRSSINKC